MGKDYSRILVTGGAGFIGSHLVDRLLSAGYEVAVIDNLSTGRADNIAHHKNRKGFYFIKGDIRDFNLVKETMKDIDAVFHEAALSSVALSIENPTLTNDVNVGGTLNLLKASLDCGLKRFILASSASVYGETRPLKKERAQSQDPSRPTQSPNSLQKTMLESIIIHMDLKRFAYAILMCTALGKETALIAASQQFL